MEKIKRKYNKKPPERPKKRYPTDLYVDQATRLDLLAEERYNEDGHVWSRGQLIREFIEQGLTDNGFEHGGQTS